MKTNLNDFFDPYNKEHLIAYRHLQEEGCFPAGFVPDDVEIPLHWQILIANKMVNAWILFQLVKGE
jgi:hypothetical protein